ncbi:MAG: zinc ribbon domain-containing protein [Bacteroidales bacterium]|jgi:hypothetical protein|nr:zinc ribbon domain-containing protein [Bacteroidales bacterium]
MEKTYKMCQSCGMPLKKDPNGGGTEKDGSKSNKYCSYCYKDGEFAQQCTAKEMQDFCVDMMHKQMKMPKFVAKFLCHNIPQLERWKQTSK